MYKRISSIILLSVCIIGIYTFYDNSSNQKPTVEAAQNNTDNTLINHSADKTHDAKQQHDTEEINEQETNKQVPQKQSEINTDDITQDSKGKNKNNLTIKQPLDTKVMAEFRSPDTNKKYQITNKDLEKRIFLLSDGKQHFESLAPEQKQEVIKEMITNDIFHLEAKKNKLHQNENIQFKIDFTTKAVYKMEFLKKFIDQIIIKYDEKIKTYNTIKKMFKENPRIEATMITIEDKEQATQICDQIKKRPDKIPALVEQTSTDIQSRQNNGKIKKLLTQLPKPHGKKIVKLAQELKGNKKKQKSATYMYYDKEREEHVIIINPKVHVQKTPPMESEQMNAALENKIKQEKLQQYTEDLENQYQVKILLKNKVKKSKQ